jgi:hypothetical protein
MTPACQKLSYFSLIPIKGIGFTGEPMMCIELFDTYRCKFASGIPDFEEKKK